MDEYLLGLVSILKNGHVGETRDFSAGVHVVFEGTQILIFCNTWSLSFTSEKVVRRSLLSPECGRNKSWGYCRHFQPTLLGIVLEWFQSHLTSLRIKVSGSRVHFPIFFFPIFSPYPLVSSVLLCPYFPH